MFRELGTWTDRVRHLRTKSDHSHVDGRSLSGQRRSEEVRTDQFVPSSSSTPGLWANYVLTAAIAFLAGVVFDLTRSGGPLAALWLALASAITGGIFAVVLAGMVRVRLDLFRLNREQSRIRRENSALRAEIDRLRRTLDHPGAE